MRTTVHTFLAVCVLGAACSGRIGGGGRGQGATGGLATGAVGGPSGGAGAAMGAAGSGGAGALAPAGMRRRTPTEYWSSVSDLLGLDASVPVPVTEDVAAISGFKNVAASTLTISAEGVSEYADAALSVSALVFDDATKRAALVGCSPAAASDPCVRTFLQAFGRRAWRRPLTGAEVDRYAGIVASLAPMADVWTGLQYAVAGLLQSPWFLYRVEVGEPDPTRARPLRFSAYEMAERLSYFLWDTTPDDALLDAAASGDTLAPAGLDGQVSRLLASPRAHAGVARFFREYLSTDDLATMTKDATLFPGATPTLAAAMQGEIAATTADLVFTRRADLRDLLDNRQTFVNAELAALYGLPGVTGTALAPATLPDSGPRAGLLGTAAFLALNARADRTSPTLRGRFVREQLLCEPVAPPPANVAATFDAPGAATAGTTLRQRLVQHMSDAACSSCHALMDPLGFAFEHFDALGAYRATEGGLAIDDTGTVDGQAFTGPRALAAALRANPAVTGCLTRQIYRYGTGHLETDGEAPVLADIGARAQAAGNAYVDYLRAIVESDGFRFAGGLR
ncbi:MAG TPA: DUF1592 domain-containing protein [Polyangia bacterium]|nr:DUF1592 domain-containing protein [Polyangia bacterium]